MTIQYYVGGKIVGLEADLKPTGVPANTTFIESDTFREFIFDGVATWNQIVNELRSLDVTGLKTYWTMNESASPVLEGASTQGSVDGLGTPADAVLTNVTFGQAGKVGDGIAFNDTNSDGVVGSSLSQFNFLHNTTAKWTIILWRKQNATGSINVDQIFSTVRGSAGETGCSAQVESSSGGTRVMSLNMGNAGAYQFLTSTTLIPDDLEYHLLVWQYDESLPSNNLTCSFDADNFTNVNKTGTRGNQNASFVGHIATQPPTSFLWDNATYNQLAIWDRILTQDEIAQIYNNGAGTTYIDT